MKTAPLNHAEWRRLEALKLLNSTLATFWCQRQHPAVRRVIWGAIREYRNVNQ